MPSVKYVRARHSGVCAAEFFHPNQIHPGDLTRVTTHFPSDEAVQCFGAPPFARWRVCQWCVIHDAIQDAQRHEYGLLTLRDRHGDEWKFGSDGLMHSPETAPFKFEYVQKKWGPLRVVSDGKETNDAESG